ncbi:MAG: hypothetical protein K8U57_15990 [Planctomycetes bacterium]|nr:hypothetical protein [Planctomycetota bacterium]
MSIAFSCSCGQPLVVEDACAGSAVNCPECGGTCVLPAPGAGSTPANAKLWKKAEVAIPVVPSDPNGLFGFGVDAGEVARERDRQVQDPEFADDKYAGPYSARAEFLTVVGAGGGGTAMFTAVLWFGFALLVGANLFYPLSLFLVGLILCFACAQLQRR